MSEAVGIREVGYLDCPGGGQVVVDGETAYIGHITGPESTSVVDVSDPKNPRTVLTFDCAHKGVHAHKVRVKDGLMLTNYEVDPVQDGPENGFRGGLRIYDVSNPHKPKEINFWDTDGRGVHRFTFDGRYAYITPTVEGYKGRICMILDLQNPEKPEEVGRWWIPGQWTAGGEETDVPAKELLCHHPIRMGDRLYVSYWFSGWYILDISDMSKPTYVSGMNWYPTFPCPIHTCLPVPFEVDDRKIMLVADEDVGRPDSAGPPAFMWVVDITDETNPVPFGSFQVDGIGGGGHPSRTGCHQPVEQIRGTEVPVSWFAQGLRVIDISTPHAPKEVRRYVPDPAPGAKRASSNDVFEDDRGLIYLMDRVRGLHILERT